MPLESVRRHSLPYSAQDTDLFSSHTTYTHVSCPRGVTTATMLRPTANTFPSLRVVALRSRPKSSNIPWIHAGQRRQFGVSTKLCQDERPQSFKNQLYESTQQRLRRERAEQARFSQYQTQSAGSRYAALTLGMDVAHSHAWV